MNKLRFLTTNSSIKSERITNILRILIELKESIYKEPKAHENDGITPEDFDNMFNNVIKNISISLGVTPNTIYDSISRRLGGLQKEQILIELRDFFTSKKNGEDTAIGKKIIEAITTKDDEKSVRNALNEIKEFDDYDDIAEEKEVIFTYKEIIA